MISIHIPHVALLQPHTVVNQLYQQTPGHHLQVYHRSHQNSESSKIYITLNCCLIFAFDRHQRQQHHPSSFSPQMWKFLEAQTIKKCLPHTSMPHISAFAHHYFVCSCTRCTTPATRAPTRLWRLVLRATRTTSTTSPTSSCKLMKTKMLHRAKC